MNPANKVVEAVVHKEQKKMDDNDSDDSSISIDDNNIRHNNNAKQNNNNNRVLRMVLDELQSFKKIHKDTVEEANSKIKKLNKDKKNLSKRLKKQEEEMDALKKELEQLRSCSINNSNNNNNNNNNKLFDPRLVDVKINLKVIRSDMQNENNGNPKRQSWWGGNSEKDSSSLRRLDNAIDVLNEIISDPLTGLDDFGRKSLVGTNFAMNSPFRHKELPMLHSSFQRPGIMRDDSFVSEGSEFSEISQVSFVKDVLQKKRTSTVWGRASLLLAPEQDSKEEDDSLQELWKCNSWRDGDVEVL